MTMTLLESSRAAWEACGNIRATRRRLKRFTYGQQWDDAVRDTDGNMISDEEHARRCGRRPITNNLIRSLVKSVVGRFRRELMDRKETGDERLKAIGLANRLDELDARALEEFLISGCAIQKVSYERRFEGSGVWIDNVNPDRFFCNRYLDPRGFDIRLIGMLHEMSLHEMKMRFGHNNRRRLRDISNIFSRSVAMRPQLGLLASPLGICDTGVLFNAASDPSLCRVIEVWTFEGDSRSGGAWHGRFFTPDGTMIDQTVSPYRHGSHPFVVNMYPLTDGEVHPFIEDVIDQQRHINQLITMIDHILAHSAKGALLFPVDAIPAGGSFESTIRMWSKPGAVIPVNARASRMPSEVVSSARSEGASQLLDLEMNMFRQISGVSTALQGQPIGGNMSASLYETQVQNSAIALLDIFETFNSFRSVRDGKALMAVDC
ncbi:hypothetical protein [uncultured Duncaniella sp.]|uniref:portal protein n=1 Tax=uncultured Duncaniella sp. TaxID=2768039 RepID=UPI0023BB9A8C|nr:hypothetical protein [uncultured Duncaniella sp.]MDE7026376.1 hypothetical protein [Duncaniella freteri]